MKITVFKVINSNKTAFSPENLPQKRTIKQKFNNSNKLPTKERRIRGTFKNFI